MADSESTVLGSNNNNQTSTASPNPHALERSPQEIARLAMSSQVKPTEERSSSPPVEMNELSSHNNNSDATHENQIPTSTDHVTQTETTTTPSRSEQDTVEKIPGPLTREDTTPALGPASDKPTVAIPSQGNQLVINLQLLTGARHPYYITEKYLNKRNVKVEDDNPVNMSVYTLKELIWRDWRDEWETRPASPTSIRLIHFGKLLDDKAFLKDGKFSEGPTPHVVHMTVKPQDVIDDEDARMAKGGSRGVDGEERTPMCRCAVM